MEKQRRGKTTKLKCDFCEKDFFKLQSKIKFNQSKNNFCSTECYSLFRAKNKKDPIIAQRAYKRKCLYDITEEDYKNLIEKQKGLCCICSCVLTNQNEAIDHCHNSKKVRGLLCKNCNTGIGMLKDSVELLKKAIFYLEESKG